MRRFDRKVVLVTGGSSGIGFAAARAFIDEGARVVITGRDPARLDAARISLGDHAIGICNATGSAAAAAELADSLACARLHLDAVFLNSGIARLAPLSSVTEALWAEVFDVNVRGPFFQIQALRARLNHGASIVLNGSVNAHVGMDMSSVYAASKAALISLARTLSKELMAHGVRVNVVSPGPVDTPLFGKLGMGAERLELAKAHIRQMVPLGRFARAEEIAATVLHLAAAESAFIVGSEILVDGGMSQL
ncbi:SDR family oxidoreductase [Comamonadaceae bacterium PP-2]